MFSAVTLPILWRILLPCWQSTSNQLHVACDSGGPDKLYCPSCHGLSSEDDTVMLRRCGRSLDRHCHMENLSRCLQCVLLIFAPGLKGS